MNACLAQMKPRKHFTAVKLMLGCTHTTLPDSLVNCVTGAEWRDFNYAQKRVRQDMVQLYGNSRDLIHLNMGADSRGDRSLGVVFALQVHSSHNNLHAPCMLLSCLQTGLAHKCLPSPHLTSPRLASPHLTSPHVTSHSSLLTLSSHSLTLTSPSSVSPFILTQQCNRPRDHVPIVMAGMVMV